MALDKEAVKANLQSFIALWQDEEQRLQSMIEDPQTSPLVREQVTVELNSVMEQIFSLAEERDAL